jgi:hypothetical protein
MEQLAYSHRLRALEETEGTRVEAENSLVAVECEAAECETEDDVSVIENNTICSLFVLISAVVLDALCALPGAVLDDVPASLRTTSLTLVVMLSAPSISTSRTFLMEQRLVIAALLLTAASIGLNRAEASARNADALFSLIGTVSSIVACATNGTAVRNASMQKQKELREHITAFYGALLFYIGARVVRHSVALPSEILSFYVAHDDVETRGYGISNEMTVVGLGFTGTIVAAFGVVVLLNHDLVLHVGSAALSKVAGVLTCFGFLGALVAQLSAYSQMELLPALFGPNACDGPQDECAAAFRARRLFTASTSTSTAWAGVVSMATFSFCCSKRVRTRREHFLFWPDLYTHSYAAVLFASFASLLVIVSYVDVEADMVWADVELLLLVASIPLVIVNFPILGCLAHLSAQIIYIYTRFTLFGYYDTMYFTHWSILATLSLTTLVALMSSISYFLYAFEDQRLYWEGLEHAVAVCIVALVSIHSFLTVGTSGMAAGYTGVYYESGKNSWRMAGYEYCTQHNVSLFFAAALYAVRYEHHALPAAWLKAAWFLPVFVVGSFWITSIAILSDEGSPYEQFVDYGSFVIGMSASAVSWLGLGLFLNS